MENCKDCGYDDYPRYTVVPYDDLTFWQKLRERLGEGVYLRDQFKQNVHYDSGVGR